MQKPEQASTALLSVYDKRGIAEFAQALINMGWKILASGGTYNALKEAGVAAQNVADIVGEAILDHRVVTLSREVHAGILARPVPEDLAELERLRIPFIDLVCVDCYPLDEEIANPDATFESVIKKTDIGGPTMIRSAAKGGRIVIVDPADRGKVLNWMWRGQPDSEQMRQALAAKAELFVARYCLNSASYHGGHAGLIGTHIATCKYGENAWMTPATMHSLDTDDSLAIDRFQIIQGELGFNGYCDLDGALQTATHICAALSGNKQAEYVAVAVKHGNACGVGISDDPEDALMGMIIGDPRAIFGGTVLTNFPITAKLAKTLLTYRMPEKHSRLIDCVIAPNFQLNSDDNEQVLKRVKCLVQNPALSRMGPESLDTHPRYRYVRGGFLKQPNYTFVLHRDHPEIEWIGDDLSEQLWRDIALAWAIGCTSTSNTITLVREGILLGNGVGQKARIDAANLAVSLARQAGHSLLGCVAYSDSFFPFPDAVEALILAGARTIVATSGSKNDERTIEVCRKHGIPLMWLPDKVARGFCKH